jgi:hypothetical protein
MDVEDGVIAVVGTGEERGQLTLCDIRFEGLGFALQAGQQSRILEARQLDGVRCSLTQQAPAVDFLA